MRKIRIATRSSPLALVQATNVANLLSSCIADTHSKAFDADVRLEVVETYADGRLDIAISELGAQGAFTKEVEKAVLSGVADLAVHSAKDLPSSISEEGLVLAGVTKRADPRDVLLGCAIENLPPGAQVATGSLRRKIQLQAMRPDLDVVGLRGNIATRINKIPPKGAIVMAKAALDRLGIEAPLAKSTIFEVEDMLPQVGQGTLAITARSSDADLLSLLEEISDESARFALSAERAFLASMGGACDAPAAAYAEVSSTAGSRKVFLRALLASADGKVIIRRSRSGSDPVATGSNLAVEMQKIAKHYEDTTSPLSHEQVLIDGDWS
ncbi:MAG: hydroxymethylbilane synthase [Firmicutes bacterium]|nr:hydroxymethylbilane synthase [Bacillota bacterium]